MMASPAPTSLLGRKLDILYFIFFLTHIPIMLAVDLTPLYPSCLKPAFLTTIRDYYINTYHDQFFVSPPAWFRVYLWLEAVFHLPVSAWAVGGLWRDDPITPVILLPFAIQTAVTTLTCIAEYLSWSTITAEQKAVLGWLYVPYLGLSVFMATDMLRRLLDSVSARAGSSTLTSSSSPSSSSSSSSAAAKFPFPESSSGKNTRESAKKDA